jgi:hypothetical protein
LEIGTDRRLFSMAWLFENTGQAAGLFDAASSSGADRLKTGRINARKLLQAERRIRAALQLGHRARR